MSQEFRLKSLDEKINYFPKKKQSKMTWWVENTKRF